MIEKTVETSYGLMTEIRKDMLSLQAMDIGSWPK